MIQTIIFSKAAKNVEEILGRPYTKIKITFFKGAYKAEFFTDKQSFQKTFTLDETQNFYQKHAGTTFKNTILKTEDQEITTLANRHGQIRRLVKKVATLYERSECPTKDGLLYESSASPSKDGVLYETSTPLATSLPLSPKESLLHPSATKETFDRKKNYILKEGQPIPFLVELGLMAKDGSVIKSRYDKFRQINRFLEYIKDILPQVTRLSAPDKKAFTKDRPLYIADFGCGKSYLTFAVYYFLKELLSIPVQITGLDLKEDVIKKCQSLADRLGYTNLKFKKGDVCQAENFYSHDPDIMITLHACDTATDFALEYAVKKKAAAILSVPCCQHEINLQLQKKSFSDTSPFASLSHWGILQERFAALATDAIRSELLEEKNYSVQLLEFIDFEGTPKNLLIRAVRRQSPDEKSGKNSASRLESLLSNLGVSQKLYQLFKKD